MWVSGKRRMLWLGLLLFVWCHLTGLSTEGGPDGADPSPESTPEESFRQGIACYREGRYDEAIDHFEASLETPTGWAEYSYFYLLDSHRKAEHVAETLGFCKAFQHRFPDSPLADRVARIEAEGYQKGSAYWLASRAYEDCLERGEDPGIRIRYGEVLEQLGRYTDAYANYQRIRERWPWSAEDQTAKVRAGKIVEEHPETIESVPRVSILRREAELCFRERDYGQALSLYRELEGFPLPRKEREQLVLRQILCLTGTRELERAHEQLRYLMREYPESREIPEGLLAVGRGYWRRDRNREAFPILTELLERYTDTEQAGRAAFILGRIHFESGHLKKAIRQYRETRFLYPGTEWEEEAAWGEAWCYYLLGKYDACAEHLGECISQEVWDISVPRALYWQARCLERAGRSSESRSIYQRTRDGYPDSYYGVLAEWRLSGKPLKEVIAPGPEGVRVKDGARDGPNALQKLGDPALPFLVDTGLLKDAVERLDWLRKEASGRGMTQEDWVEAYCLAGDYLKGLIVARQAGLLFPNLQEGISGEDAEAERMLHLLYPPPTRYDIQEKARQRGLDPFLVAGLIHQESVFMQDALSPAGAVGLMQIMPATGRRVAERIGLKDFDAASLLEPGVNVTIGTAYLQGLADQYDGDWPKVFAAYNAGPGAVARWTARMPHAETDEFVESILYRETRIYVRKVLFNWSLYHRIYGSGPLSGPLPEESPEQGGKTG